MPSLFRMIPALLVALATPLTGHVVQKRQVDETNPLSPVVEQLSSTVQMLQARLSALEERIDMQQPEPNEGGGSNSPQVAFMTQFADDHALGVSQGPYVFDNPILNVGNAYDPSSGIFTAPVTGIYILSLQLFTDSTRDAEHPFVDIKLNGNTLARMAFDEGDGGSEDSDSTTVTVHLQAGDRVWVDSDEGQEYHYWGMYHSFFTGTLIAATPNGGAVVVTPPDNILMPTSTQPPF